jgi:hypothetical protein
LVRTWTVGSIDSTRKWPRYSRLCRDMPVARMIEWRRVYMGRGAYISIPQKDRGRHYQLP